MRSQRHRSIHPLPEPLVSDRQTRHVAFVPYCDMAPGNILYVRIPDIDGTGDKIRPAVVIKMLDNRACVVAPITASPSRHNRLHCLCQLQLSPAVSSWATAPLVIIDRKLDAVGVGGALDIATWEILQNKPWIKHPGPIRIHRIDPRHCDRTGQFGPLNMARPLPTAQRYDCYINPR